jgi:hypothetical protein
MCLFVQHSDPYYLLLILVDSKLLQILHLHPLQRPRIRSLQHHLRNLPILVPRPRIKRLLPPRHAQAPLAPFGKPYLSQIVAPTRAKVEKLIGHDAGYRVVACIGFGRFAVAGAHVACQRAGAVQGEGLLEDWGVLAFFFFCFFFFALFFVFEIGWLRNGSPERGIIV